MSGLLQRLRAYLLTGVLVTAPLGITVYLCWLILDFVDSRVRPLIPLRYNPETYLPFSLPGLGVLVLLFGLALIGFFAAGLVGRWIVGTGEKLLSRTPVIRSLYGAVKQVMEAVLAQKSNAFRQCVLIEYPRRGAWTIAFVTGRPGGEVAQRTGPDHIAVYVPTTPNPTSGFLLFVPPEDVVPLKLPVEDGLKLVISLGIVAPAGTPPSRRPADYE
ncbi:MAG: DUF502 domain-containing protein [Thalassobaculales bacterium]